MQVNLQQEKLLNAMNTPKTPTVHNKVAVEIHASYM